MIHALANVQPRYLMDGRFTPFTEPETAANPEVEEF
jgi:hypothetical protein